MNRNPQTLLGSLKRTSEPTDPYIVDTVTPARLRKKTLGRKERKITQIFHLEKEGCEKVQVCQKMFFATLGLTEDRVIRTVLSETTTSTMANISDKRGKHTLAIQKKDKSYQLVIDHIQKLRPCISYYQRAHALNRLYICPEFTITSMYQDCCREHLDIMISNVYYYKNIKSLNIIFVKFSKEYEKCDLHEKHLENCHQLSKVEFCEISIDRVRHMKTFYGCDDCVNFTKHITPATEARSHFCKEKECEWAEHEVTMSVDMQKVIMLSRFRGLKQVILCKRLLLFNETFVPVECWKKSKTLKPTGVLWHETLKGRSAEDVASTFIHFIYKNRDIQSFIFLADNCSAQNKNWFIFTALARVSQILCLHGGTMSKL